MKNPNDVITSARKLIDTPYLHQGRIPNKACDCLGVPVLVGLDLGLFEDMNEAELKQILQVNYPRIPDGTLESKIAKICQPIPMQPGALLVFRISVEAQHCGILSDFPRGGVGLIHAWDIVGRVVEHRLGDWQKKIVSICGLPGIDYPKK